MILIWLSLFLLVLLWLDGVFCVFKSSCTLVQLATLREITIVLFSLIYGDTKFNFVFGDFSGLTFYDLIFNIVTCKSMFLLSNELKIASKEAEYRI